jgi:hypothetical protein
MKGPTGQTFDDNESVFCAMTDVFSTNTFYAGFLLANLVNPD